MTSSAGETAATSNSARTQGPSGGRGHRSTDPTFVLVHGSCSSSFMWAPVQRELALLGRRSYAVDLPGHGFDAQYSTSYQAPQDLAAWALEPSPLAGVTLQDNVDLVVDVVRRLAERGPVVLRRRSSREAELRSAVVSPRS